MNHRDWPPYSSRKPIADAHPLVRAIVIASVFLNPATWIVIGLKIYRGEEPFAPT